MCGIVAYIGKREAKDLLIDGLKRLEYRGYDSSGIAIIGERGLIVSKAVGKISSLEEKVNKNNKISGSVGISHTRWATHGEPSVQNAHPHTDCSKKIAIVHNGIIENYSELKEGLEKKGHSFCSQTDTEVLAHLIESFYQGNLKEAVRKTISLVRGTYGIAVVSKDEPEKIIAARMGSPLILGIGDGENFVASDVSAFLGHTNRVVYLNDGDLVELGSSSFQVFDSANNKKEIPLNSVEWSIEESEKAGFDSFMLKEIHEQPEVIENTIRGRIVLEEGNVKLGGLIEASEELKKIKRIIIVACGTARYAGLVGEYMLEEYAGIPVEVEYASEFRYRNTVIDKETAVLAISQSGETVDTLAAIKEAKMKGALTIGIVNVVGSTIARETDAGVYNHAGPEIAVASTKAFTSQLVVLVLLTVLLARQRGMGQSEGEAILRSLKELPNLLRGIIKEKEKIKEIAEKYKSYKHFMYLGRKYSFPLAEEGSLKLKEISYIHAEAYASGEMKHGPIALIDKNFPTFAIVPSDSVYEKSTSNVMEIKARKGLVIALTTSGNKDIASIADDVIYIPNTLEPLWPILGVAPVQLFAYYVATLKGKDVDKPRNLAKSVTVE